MASLPMNYPRYYVHILQFNANVTSGDGDEDGEDNNTVFFCFVFFFIVLTLRCCSCSVMQISRIKVMCQALLMVEMQRCQPK